MRETILNFLGTGMVVLPVVIAIGTASLDAVAMCLFALLMLQLGVLMFRADDPIGDKLRAEQAKDKNKPPQ